MRVIHQKFLKSILSKQLLKPGGRFGIGIYCLLNLFVTIAALVSVFQGDGKHLMTCFKIMIMFLIPWLIEWKFKIELSSIFILIIHVFMYAAVILGELDSYYLKYPYWDTILHAISGFLSACAGFMLVHLIGEQKQKLKLWIKPIYIVVFAFCLSMTVGVMWEFYEFGMDNLCNRDMQKDTIIHTIKSVKLNQENHSLTILNDVSNVTVNGQDYDLGGYLDIGLYDTMGDLFINLGGALLCCVIGYFALKKDYKYPIVNCFFYVKVNSEHSKPSYIRHAS